MATTNLAVRAVEAMTALYQLEDELDVGNPLTEWEYDQLRRLTNRWRVDTMRKIDRALTQYETATEAVGR